MKTRLYDLARVLRSKNSGPFAITLDVLFDDETVYKKIKTSGVITAERIAELYKLGVEQITTLVFFDAALGFKITFDRPVSSGSPLDTDVYGAQFHAPLMEMQISLD